MVEVFIIPCYNYLDKSEFVGIGIQENIQKITHLWG